MSSDGTTNSKKGAAKSVDDLSSCANCGKPAGGAQRCARCRRVAYCNRRCQKAHWSKGGHRQHCTPAPTAGASVQPAVDPAPRLPASDQPPPAHAPGPGPGFARGPEDPEHPCPICLVNEDRHGYDTFKFSAGPKSSGMCFECGHMYCADCEVTMTERVELCPTCRAPFDVSSEVQAQRLKEMLKRSPGRHTPVAQQILGTLYEFGNGVPKNHKTSYDWYKRAADQGDAQAETCVGVNLEHGKGVSQNSAEAARWYLRAAIQGRATAQKNLGFLYRTGNGVPQSDSEAVRWYRKAAAQGHPEAQSNLGFMYHHGHAVTLCNAEAVKWYRLAADQGYANGQFNLGNMYDFGDGVAQNRNESAKWYGLAADQGLAEAQFKLGCMHAVGFPRIDEVKKDDAVATMWFQVRPVTVVFDAAPLVRPVTVVFDAVAYLICAVAVLWLCCGNHVVSAGGRSRQRRRAAHSA